MKKFLHISTHGVALMALLVCVIAISSVPAVAQQSTASVNRVPYQGETHTGLCCTTWDPSVTINETERIRPIVITWSTDYQATAPFLAALRLNDGPCTFFGPAFLPAFTPDDELTYSSRTFQWIVMPGDYKLVRGKNVLTVCGGGTNSASDTITLGFNTLSAQLQK